LLQEYKLITADVKRGFQDIITLNDPLCGDILDHFWPESSSPMPSQLLSDSPYAAIDMGMDDDLRMLFQNPSPMPKPFGIALLQEQPFDNDDLVYQQGMIPNLTSFLANIPYVDEKEAQVLRELLLGPPSIEAARRCTYQHSLHSLFCTCYLHYMYFKCVYILVEARASLFVTFLLDHD
jgi:hypothetical protein